MGCRFDYMERPEKERIAAITSFVKECKGLIFAIRRRCYTSNYSG